MATSMESMAEDIKGFQLMMQQMLDKMNSFEAWRTSTDSSLGTLLTKTTETTSRISTLEKAPLPPPPPPAGRIPGTVDLNTAPSPSSSAERPNGHSAGGGVLGPIPGTSPPPIIPQGNVRTMTRSNQKALGMILEKLRKKDRYGVLVETVDPEELPDYHDVIEHPMDHGSIRNKLAGMHLSNLRLI